MSIDVCRVLEASTGDKLASNAYQASASVPALLQLMLRTAGLNFWLTDYGHERACA